MRVLFCPELEARERGGSVVLGEGGSCDDGGGGHHIYSPHIGLPRFAPPSFVESSRCAFSKAKNLEGELE